MRRWMCFVVCLGTLVQCARAQDGQPAQETAPNSSEQTPSQADPLSVEDVLNLDLERLGQISVRDTPSAPSASSLNVPATVVENLDFGGIAESSTGGLLDQARSVSVRRTSSVNLDPRVRGYSAEQLAASANGIPQRKTRIDIDSLFSQIDPGIVNNVTVYDGPYTAIYGPGLAFLIVDLYSTERYAAPEFHGRSIFQHQTNGRQLYWREGVWGGGQDWGFRASYGQRVGNDYQPGSDSFEYRIPSSYNQWDGFVTLSKDVNSWSRIDFDYIRTEQNDVELPGVVYDINHSNTDQFNLRWVAQESPDEPERARLQYWWSRTSYYGDSRHPSKQTTVFRDFVTNNFLGLAPPLDVFNLANTFVDGAVQSTGARGFLRFGDPSATLFTVGADWQRFDQRHFEDTVNFFGQSAITDNPGFLIIPGINDGEPNYRGIPGSSQNYFGVFSEVEQNLTSRLKLRVGGRLDFVNSTLETDDVIAADSAFLRQTGNNEPNDLLGLGFLSGTFQLTDNWSVESSVGYAMRAPTLSELYSNSPTTPIIRFTNAVNGVSTLDPERDLQFDLGLRGEWETVNLSVRAFHATVHDYILPIPYVAAPTPRPTGFGLNRMVEISGAMIPVADNGVVFYRYANVDRASLYGGDASLEWQLNRWLTAQGTLSYVKGTNHAPIMGIGNLSTALLPSSKSSEALPNVYPLNATLSLRLAEPDDNSWSITVAADMVNGQRYIAQNLGEVGTAGFTTVGIRGHVKLTEGLTFRTAVENVFDRTYSEHGSLAIINPAGNVGFVKEPGISWLVGMEARF